MMEIIIGKYRILQSHGKIWIFIDSGEGEGMETSEEKFEKVIERFYYENF